MSLEEIADETERYLVQCGLEKEALKADIKFPLRSNLRTDPRYFDSDHYILHYLMAYCHVKSGNPIPDNILTRMTLEGNKWAALFISDNSGTLSNQTPN